MLTLFLCIYAVTRPFCGFFIVTMTETDKQEKFFGFYLDKSENVGYNVMWLANANSTLSGMTALSRNVRADRLSWVVPPEGRFCMMPLAFADKGVENVILKVGGSAEVKKHLESLGFVPGGRITVISVAGGNVIVNVKQSRVAVSREMAMKIMV